MKHLNLFFFLTLSLGLVSGCPTEDPLEEPKQTKEEEQEVVTLDAGVPDGTSPEEDAGSAVPPETSDAGTDETITDGGTAAAEVVDSGVSTTDPQVDAGMTLDEMLAAALDAGWVWDGGFFIPPYTTEADYSDGGYPLETAYETDGGSSNNMGSFAVTGGITCDTTEYFGCNDPNETPGTCCKTGKEECYYINRNVPRIKVAKCSPLTVEACDDYGDPGNWKLCPGTAKNKEGKKVGNACCKTNQICKVSEPIAFGLGGGFAFCVEPYCLTGHKCGESPTPEAGKYGIFDCCPEPDMCKDLGYGFYACDYNENTCKDPKELCTGKWNRCCPEGTTCAPGGTGNPNCIPKPFTECKGMNSSIDPASGQCECESTCPIDDPMDCNDNGCGEPCNTCDNGYSCQLGTCLPDEEETPDAGTSDPEPTADAGSSSGGCGDGCEDFGLECTEIPEMPGRYQVSYQKGTCVSVSEFEETFYCTWVIQPCESDQCAYGVCDE